jgi:hypothetical protein
MSKIKNLLVFHIDVGQLPPFKAEAFIERLKDSFNTDGIVDRLREQGHEILWLPCRPNSSTHVELVQLAADNGDYVEAQNISNANAIKSSQLLTDKDILMKWLKYSEEEAERAVQKMKIQKLEDIKLQVLAQNPQITGIPVPEKE